jgi:hypothetical protein
MGKTYFGTMETIFMSFLLEAFTDTVMKIVHFKSLFSSSIDSSAKTFKLTASHFVRARQNFMSNNCEISFKLLSTILKLNHAWLYSIQLLLP